MSERKYYEAYDDRYRQVHRKGAQWASNVPTDIVGRILDHYGIGKDAHILELGCGEGRDAAYLLSRGYDVTATDLSPEAVRYCRENNQDYSGNFQVLDCVAGQLDEKFDFIYAVAVIHMLVEDADRAAFYRFIRNHLKQNGIALVCTMGDGRTELASDISAAFELLPRTHGQSGEKMLIAGTSCRIVCWETFLKEIRESGLTVVECDMTEAPPDFSVMMYVVLK